MTQLSHSAMGMYERCPRQYKLHYRDRLREINIGSALHFGGAVDEALNALLLRKMDNLTKEQEVMAKSDPRVVFDFYWSRLKVRNDPVPQEAATSIHLDYFKSDLDVDLLIQEDLDKLAKFIDLAGYEEKDPLKLLALVQEQEKADMDVTNLGFNNYVHWMCLRRKAYMMFDCYETEIMPMIKKVHSIQKKVELPNDSGDLIIGYIDFECEFEGKEGIYTVDNKTSSSKYKASDINDKGQLPLYDEYTQNGKAAYIVLLKKVRKTKIKTCKICKTVTERRVKTCPEGKGKNRCNGDFDEVVKFSIDHQVLGKEIDEEKKDLLFEKIGVILEGIEENEFPQNRDECFQFGRKCPYFNYCREGDEEGLCK
jgi:hypothetical protein